jgi:predicted RNase H-like HicB family nuclease
VDREVCFANHINKLLERFGMLTYKAMYKFLDQGVHAEVLDFPGTITYGETLQEARRLLASALADMAETTLLRGEPLPVRLCAYLI